MCQYTCSCYAEICGSVRLQLKSDSTVNCLWHSSALFFLSSNQSSVEAAVHLHSLRDPCSPLDYVENITIDKHSVKIRGLGDFGGCKRALLPLLQNPAGSSRERGSGTLVVHTPCTEANCSLDLIPNFQRSELNSYGYSIVNQ